jgi:heme A synthase
MFGGLLRVRRRRNGRSRRRIGCLGWLLWLAAALVLLLVLALLFGGWQKGTKAGLAQPRRRARRRSRARRRGRGRGRGRESRLPAVDARWQVAQRPVLGARISDHHHGVVRVVPLDQGYPVGAP